MNHIELKRNGTSKLSECYTPNFVKGQYIEAYMTFLHELECDTGDEPVTLTLSECANGYTLYAFKITDGLIGSSTYGPHSKSAMGSARLEVLFVAVVNKNIKVIQLYQLLGKIEFYRFNAVFVL